MIKSIDKSKEVQFGENFTDLAAIFCMGDMITIYKKILISLQIDKTVKFFEGAELRQRPFPDGQRDTQPASPAEAQCALHSNCCPPCPGHAQSLQCALYWHR